MSSKKTGLQYPILQEKLWEQSREQRNSTNIHGYQWNVAKFRNFVYIRIYIYSIQEHFEV